MWLILTAHAAVVTAFLWYKNAPDDTYKIGTLSLCFWGATIMWLVDHIIAFTSEGGEFFEVDQNATLLGISVILIALVTWMCILLIKDPKGILKNLFTKKIQKNA